MTAYFLVCIRDVLSEHCNAEDDSTTVVEEVTLRPALPSELDVVNRVVQRAVDTWRLPARVRRLATPSFNYSRHDLEHMNLLLALDAGGDTCGVAAFENAGSTEAPPGRSALLLHGLYVAPEVQRRGIGARLLDATLRVAMTRGLGGVAVRAWRDAEGFFSARGFATWDPAAGAGTYPRRLWRAVE